MPKALPHAVYPLFRILITGVLFALPGNLLAQTSIVTASNPTAVALASQALQAIAGGTALSDITIQATANYVAGSDQETGTATLVALGNAQSLVTLNLSGGQRQDIRNGIAGVYIGPDGIAHAMATHNCFIDANWYFPPLSLAALATDPTQIITLVGQQVYEGHQVYHLTLFHYLGTQSPGIVALVERVSALDLYLDATTFQPVALDFNIHPNNDAGTNIPAEIRFGAYQQFNGVWAATRIQKYVQNTLLLDLTVTGVAVNSGVSASVFTLPTVSGGGAQ